MAWGELAFNEAEGTLWYGAGNDGSGRAVAALPIAGSGAFLPLSGGALTGPIRTSNTAPLVVSSNAFSPATSAGSTLRVLGADGQNTTLSVESFGSSGQNPIVVGRRSGGTSAAQSGVTTDYVLLNVAGQGWSVTGLSGLKVMMSLRAAEPWNDAAQGTYLTLATVPTGATAAVERARLLSSGLLLIGGTVADGSELLQVANGIRAPSFRVGAGTGPTVTSGAGAPGGTAPVASLFLRSDGAAGSQIYINTDGVTNWQPMPVGGPFLPLAGNVQMTGPILTGTPNTFTLLNGVMTTTPPGSGVIFRVVSSVGGNSRAVIETYNNSQPAWIGKAAGGTPTVPSAVALDQTLCRFEGWGWGSTTFVSSANVTIRAAQAFSDTAAGGYIQFNTAPIGTVTPVERLRITDQGALQFAIAGPSISVGTGAPGGTAPVASLFLRSDGAVGSQIYVNTTGAGSGWSPLITDAPNDAKTYGRGALAWKWTPTIQEVAAGAFNLNTIADGFIGLRQITNQTGGVNWPADQIDQAALVLEGYNAFAYWQSQLMMGGRERSGGPAIWYRSVQNGAWGPWWRLIGAINNTISIPLTLSAGLALQGSATVTLARDPTADLEAVPRRYVDARSAVVVASIAALRALNGTAAWVYAQGYYAPGDGGGGDYVRGVAGTDNGGSIITTANGTYYLQTYGRPLSVTQFGAKGDGVTDDYAAMQAAINAVQAAGGGTLWFPARTFAQTVALRISQSGVRLVGAGRDAEHDYTPGWGSNSNTRAVTALLWIGPGGSGHQIDIAPLSDSDGGGALGGCAVLDMNLFAGVFPYTNAATVGVYCAAVKDSEFSFFALEHLIAGLQFSCLNRSASWNNGVSFCRVPYLGYRGVQAGSGSALRMDGISFVGNAYNNTFGLINVLHNNNQGLDLYSCDNNTFNMVRIQRVSGGVGAGIYLRSGASVDTPARANVFNLVSPGHGGVYSDATGAYPPFENKILFYNPDEDSAPAVPAIGNGSTLFYNTSKQSAACYFSVTTNNDQSIPSGVWTTVAFNTVTIDPATWFDTTNRRWRPRYPGVYHISASVAFNIAATGGSRHIQIAKNSATTVVRTQRLNTYTGIESLTINASVYLNGTTDFVEIWVQQDTGVAATIVNLNDLTFFNGSRAG
jgi:hypothetical protein